MLCRTKHGFQSLSSTLPNLLFSPFLLLHSSPLSTTPKPVSKTPKPNSSVSSSLSHATTICSLLANPSPRASSSSVDDLLQGFEGNLSSNLVLEVLTKYRQLGRSKTLEFFSWAGSQMGFEFDDSVIEYMADFLGRRKLFDDMKCFLLSIRSHKGNVSCRTFSICIRHLGRQGRVVEALCLFDEMGSKFGCQPDNLVYNNMLYVLCKKSLSGHSIDLALEIFRRIELPDTYSYSNIVVGLCKSDRLETALEVFGEMGKAGLVPTRTAANVLIGKLCWLSSKEGAVEEVRVSNARRPFTILVPNVGAKSGAIEPAIRVFWAVYDLGLLPSSFVVVQLVEELCRLGKTDAAVEVLKVVEQLKVSCRDESYSVVISALCYRRCVEQAGHLFGRMQTLGMKPKLSVYNSVISMLCKSGNLDDAERVYKVMNKKRCLPNNLTYSLLIHGYVEARNWEAAYDLLMEMLGFNWSPHFHTYDMVTKLLSQVGKTDLCLKLENKLESQALQKLCKMGRLEDAYEKMRSMLDKGVHPPGYVKDAFERAFEKAGKPRLARELLARVDDVQFDERNSGNVNVTTGQKSSKSLVRDTYSLV